MREDKQQEEGQVYSQFKRLQNANDGREFMQKLINSYDKNEISKDKARTLGYLIKIFISTYETAEIEERIEKLEEIAKKNTKSRRFG